MNRPPRHTILIIDDDSVIRELVTELLAVDGHWVLSASSGEDGLTRARADHPDLILLDYHMPGMDGLAVISRLRADAATKRIPVVALTSGTAHDANALSRAGCIGFIPKPFEPVGFRRVVTEFLNETVRRTRRAGDSHPDT